MSTQKEVVRFTFDCPVDLHTIAKMKASALKKSLREYLVSLLVKDAMENPPKFLDNKAFKKELKKILEDDADLMRKLADK
ncbi:MAG: hypothetical protein ACHQUC_10480 [Chlamydiales bacterium]